MVCHCATFVKYSYGLSCITKMVKHSRISRCSLRTSKCFVDQELDVVEYVKCEDRNLLIVLNSEKLAHYSCGCYQEVRWSIYYLYPSPFRYQVN